MHKRFILLLISFLLVICYQMLESNAKECINMDVHAREVVNCCRYERICSEEVDEKCNLELTPQMIPRSPNFTVCFIDCAYREMGFLTENNEIDLAQYASFLFQFKKDYRKVAVKAVGDCGAIQQDIARDVDKAMTTCSAFALMFHVCVTQLILQNCPDGWWEDSEICNEVKMGIPLCN